MKLIVGLGNPGRQYENTPHNVGFDAVNLLAARHSSHWTVTHRYEAETSEVQIAGTRVTLMKPLTYMNLSGRSVGTFVRKNGLAADEILVVSDDLHLPLGKIRIRPGGSHGGQKGLLSIIQALGTMDYPRLRIGVKPEGIEVRDNAQFVLGKFRPADRENYALSCQDAADAAELVVKEGVLAAMNRFNGKS